MRLTAALILLLAAATPARAEEWTTYTDTEAGFSVSYPADWKAESRPMPEAVFRMMAPEEGSDVCIINHAILPGLDALSWDEALSGDFTEIMLRMLRQRFSDVAPVAGGRREISGQPATYLEAIHRVNPPDSSPLAAVRSVMYFTVANGRGYIVACSFPYHGVPGISSHSRGVIDAFRILKMSSEPPTP